MDAHTIGYGGRYEEARRPITNEQLRRIRVKIFNSDRFEMGKLDHIVLAGTETIVGFLGDVSVDLCCPSDEALTRYRVPHTHLRRIFRSV